MFRTWEWSASQQVWETIVGAVDISIASDIVAMDAWEVSMSMPTSFMRAMSSRPNSLTPRSSRSRHPEPT